MTKKSLQSWYNSGDITYSQKEIISKFGVSDYSPEYPLWDLKKLYYFDDIFERNKQKINIRGQITKMIFFSTDWNNSLIIVVSGDDWETREANLIVYEMPMKSGYNSTEILEKINLLGKWESGDVNKVYEMERKLKQKNPIYIFSGGFGVVSLSKGIWVRYDNDYNSDSYPMHFWPETVKRFELPYDLRYNPDKYIKPLDIVLACHNIKGGMVHSCVYLGDKKICHVLGEGGGKVKIESWNSFLSIISADKILRYHPVIAFKDSDTIVRHISRAIRGTASYFSPGTKTINGSFSMYKDCEGSSNNCENFTNVCVLGMNFSELAVRKGENPPAGQVYSIETCITESNIILDNLTYKGSVIDGINEINRYKNSVYHSQGIKMEGRIEVQPKGWYRLN